MKKKFLEALRSEIPFFLFFIAVTWGIVFLYGNVQIAMWLGFALAAYSSIGNDSINPPRIPGRKPEGGRVTRILW